VKLMNHRPASIRPQDPVRNPGRRRPGLQGGAVALACALALLLAWPTGQAFAQAQPSAVPAVPELRSTWDLTPLFASDEAWDAERRALAAELPRLAELRAGFGRDARSLREALDRLSAVQQRFSRLWVYASAHASTDNRNARNQERSGLMRSMGGQFGSATSWVNSAIQDLGAQRVEAMIRADPGLEKHAVRLRDTLRQARHQLHPEAEAALAAMSPVLNAAGSARTLLTTVDIEWPRIRVDGQDQRLDNVGYSRLRAHPDRAVRQQVFQSFFGVYSRHENTLGTLLAQRVEAGVIQARMRKHPSAVAASLSENDIPESVYRTLVAEVNRGLPTLHRYFRLRQTLMGLPDLAYHDIYPELVSTQRRYSLADSAALTLAAVAPLGPEFQALQAQAYGRHTMHVYPAEGKSSGAYQSGIYGLTPLIFLNHQDTFASLSTFAHEWGHGMHTLLANQAQPFETARYPLFLAEIAAFSHELLLQHHMLSQAGSREERLFLLDQALERLRGAFFRQTMFAEFELATHDAVARGEAMTGRRMTQVYCDLLRRYHGAEQGVMRIDPAYCSEWAFIPHFHRPFYVYQYATSMAAASHFTRRLIRGEPGARETYLDVLRSGGSRHPVPLLKDSGLDMTSPEPYRELIRQMDRLLDEMERLLAG
jgi:oligoendopeptidase F